ncbi:hypothetical protein N0V91_005949 [Didymella pomorum]|uniref:Uncharacterized protein n=1 Tax=Didymella pomorum TaxID=749634 RepID=A0A9W8ZEF3_9PLEO|nr:hypothetical protein N0V91_005949 [Didymella pomorum]
MSEAIESSLRQATAELEALEKEKNAIVQADADRYDFSEWLSRAGWARHLKGLKRDWLLEMARKPTPKERGLFNTYRAGRSCASDGYMPDLPHQNHYEDDAVEPH